MHKPSISRINLLSTIASAIGIEILSAQISTARIFREQRGQAPLGKKWRDRCVYIPGGPYPNVEPTKVKNPKIAAHVQMMHERWLKNRLISLETSMSNLERKMTDEKEAITN